jgi:hypothetical protein
MRVVLCIVASVLLVECVVGVQLTSTPLMPRIAPDMGRRACPPPCAGEGMGFRIGVMGGGSGGGEVTGRGRGE